MRLAYLPLDDRPCNTRTVEELARISGEIELSIPERGLFSRDAHSDLCWEEWLRSTLSDQAHPCRALILSLDQWCFGGLVQARDAGTALETAHARIERLGAILSDFPRVPVYAFSTLIRLTLTVRSSIDEAMWKDLFDLSVLSHQIEKSPQDFELRKKFDLARDRVPQGIWSAYLSTRARNHEIQERALELLPRFKTLVIAQEDCAPEGPHRSEREKLENQARALPPELRRKLRWMNGADELGALFLAEAYRDLTGSPLQSIPVRWNFLDPSVLDRVAIFEDLPIRENILAHLESTPFQAWGSSPEEGIQIAVTSFPKSGQGDLFPVQGTSSHPIQPSSPSDASTLRDWLAGISGEFALLDLRYGNGADPELIQALRDSGKLSLLATFSAWNTAGNRIGTLLAHLSIREIAKNRDRGPATGTYSSDADRWCRHARLLDDFAYQTQIRPHLWQLAREKGLDPWRLGDRKKSLETLAQALLTEKAAALGLSVPKPRLLLPWERLFEAEIIDASRP